MHDTTTAARILQVLAEAGVRTAFGLPGVHNLAFWRELGPDLPRIISVRHEQTAAYAADGLARATGGLGVAFTTTGPGAANAVAAFGEAAACGIPVLVIASEIPTTVERHGVSRGVLHESRDQAALFAPLAKAVYRPRRPEDAVAAVAEAASLAMTHPRGPVYVDVPTDVLDRPAPAVPYPRPPVPEPASPADLAALTDLVNGSERVVLWAGGGVIQAGAADELAALADRLAAPVITTYAARGVLPPKHDLLVGLPPHEPEVARYVADADLLLGVGTRFDAMMTKGWSMPRPPSLAAVNVDPADLTVNYRPDVAVRGDAAEVLAALARSARPRERTSAAELAELRGTAWDRLTAVDPEPVRFLRAVGEALPEEATVVADMAVAGYWWGGYGQVARPRALAYPVGWGTLGFALPAAIGAAVRGPALAVCGDGGVMFALGELATAVQERLPLTVLVVDDGGYGMLRFDQDRAGDPHRGVDLVTPDWATLGRAFGIPVAVADSVGEPLAEALHEALRAGEPRMVVVHAALHPPRTTSPRWHE